MKDAAISQQQQQTRNPLATMPPLPSGEPVRDSSGYAVYSKGDIGAMHVLAHRLLDSGQPEPGYHMLRAWLEVRSGQGSRWVHLQWHMAVFEISLGHWRAALNRFREHILPAVVRSYDALTDAPALLWRISLETGGRVSLPWQTVRDRALLSLRKPCTTFVKLHNLLALAGAGDVDNIEAWIRRQQEPGHSRDDAFVIRFADALRAFVTGDFATAASGLTTFTPKITRIGGSRAQNEIFSLLRNAACQKATTKAHTTLLQAA